MLKKFFAKRARYFVRIMITPVLILFFMLFCAFFVMQNRELAKEGENFLHSLSGNLEYSIYNTIRQQNVMMSSSKYKLSLKKVLGYKTMDQTNLDFFNALNIILGSYETSHDYVHSIYLYMDGVDRFMTSSERQIAALEGHYDAEWFREYQGMAEDEQQFVSARTIRQYAYADETEVISIYQRMTFADGVIVVNLDKSSFGKMVRNLRDDENQQYLMLNEKGDIIYCTDQELLANGVIADKTLRQAVTEHGSEDSFGGLDGTWVTVGNKKYLVSIRKSDYLKGYGVSLISGTLLWERMRFTTTLWLIFLLLNIVLAVLLAWNNTRRSFNYISEWVDVFSAAEKGVPIEKPGDVVKDEYDLILNNIIYMYLKNNQMRESLVEKQHQNEISEMMALQMQINPHFIFNTLQIIDFEIIKCMGSRSVQHKLLQNLAQTIKYALNDPSSYVTVREELEYLKTYMEIQEIRHEGRCITYYEIEEELYDRRIFRIMMQPMVENCVTHGMRGGSSRLIMKIKIFRRGDRVYVSVVDNGKGMNREAMRELRMKVNDVKSKNIGLTNLNRRLILHYGPESALSIYSKEKVSTWIGFSIPIDRMPDSSNEGQNVTDEDKT